MFRVILVAGIFVMAISAFGAETAVVITNFGSFTIELYRADAPRTVENFVQLAKKGYYDNTRVHRISHEFVIQMGDPLTRDTTLKSKWGTGGESIYGKTFADELNQDSPSYNYGYQKGVVAMANAGPNTNGSQFFVTLDDLSVSMPHSYTIFGKIIDGMDVVQKIGEQPITGNKDDGIPANDIVITSITIK